MMWATDATQIATVQDGKVWLFGVIEHWNAELVGWHVAKHGTRFEATQGSPWRYASSSASVRPGVARGLALDQPTTADDFMADHFQKQIRSWGIAPSFAFVAEPQTNGVIERFFRTFKEVVHGGSAQTMDGHVRDAVRSFVARYNAEWLIRRMPTPGPTQARAAWREAAAFRHAGGCA